MTVSADRSDPCEAACNGPRACRGRSPVVLNLYDMMNQAQEGQVYAYLARRFDLTEAEARAAVETLLPVFSAALKRSTNEPAGLAEFLRTLTTGPFAGYFDDPRAAQSAAAQSRGNDVLGRLFGSPEVSRAVAAQAAAISGIHAEILKQMMPVVAATLMGGLARQIQTPMLQGLFEQMWRNMGLPGAGAAGPGREAPVAANAWGRMVQGMIDAWLDQASASTRPAGATGSASPATGRDLFGEMFDAGQAALRRQAAAWESLLDDFIKGAKRD